MSGVSFVFDTHAVARPGRARPSREKWRPTLRHGAMQTPARHGAVVHVAVRPAVL